MFRLLTIIAVVCGLLLLSLGSDRTYAAEGDTPELLVVPEKDPATPKSGQPRLDAANHMLSRGDLLLAQFFDGVESEEYRLQVDAAGEVTMPLIGSVNISGMTPREASELLVERLQEFYVDPQLTLQVLDFGLIEIFVFGTDFTGRMYKVPNGTRLLTALEKAGIAESGKYRRVHVVRGGFELAALAGMGDDGSAFEAATLSMATPMAVARTEGTLTSRQNWRSWIDERRNDQSSNVWVIDPLSITLDGDLDRNNLVLENGDAVYIPTAERMVTISGVSRPGDYELLEEETLGDLLRIAGTIDYMRDLHNTVIQRYDEHGSLIRLIFNLYPALDDAELSDDFLLCNHDEVKIFQRESRIFVLGEVKMAGMLSFREDATVLDYLAEAGGETDSAHLAWIAIIRQSRNRLNPHAAAEVIRVNFKDIHAGRMQEADASLLPGDVIYVPPKGAGFKASEIISATGALITGYAVVDNSNNN